MPVNVYVIETRGWWLWVAMRKHLFPPLIRDEMARVEALICVLILKAGTVPFYELKIRTRRGHM